MDAVSTTAIQQLKTLCPPTAASLRLHPVLGSPWYLVAAVAFNAARRPDAVASVYQVALEDLKAYGNGNVDFDDHVTLVKKMQEALLKASVTNGIPRAVTTISLLNNVVPKDIIEKLSLPLRDFARPLSDFTERGHKFLTYAFGEVGGARAEDILKSSSPDIAIFTAFSYGLVLGYSSVVSMLEMSYSLIAASILDDFPREASWFYLAAMQQGATVNDTKAIREMALKVASLTNVTFHEQVPEVIAREVIQVY
ncbi:hypothetical protein ONZ45_g6335 [Pleurotus djamor]|nr:hypothetical protein ONZ45_g6335 [Pleurotus djamor]